MIWVAWKQHRWSIITAISALALGALAIVGLWLTVSAAAADAGAAGCLGNDNCPHALTAGGEYSPEINMLAQILYYLPIAVGAIAGAPLFARELSQGTHVFSLTQSISRKRWWATKLAVVLIPLAVATLLLGLLSRWLFWPLLGLSVGPLDPGYFETHGFAMVGYMTLAFGVAATVGLFTKNNVVPIVVTICLLGALALATVLVLRPHYMPPASETRVQDFMSVAEDPPSKKGWDLGRFDVENVTSHEKGCGEDGCHNEKATVVYQPADRYWAFQGIETGIYLTLAAGTIALSAVGLRTRLP